MKGIVFTEFIELVEDKFGYEISDQIISSIDSETNGVYTAVGTYRYTEMIDLVQELSKITNIEESDLLYIYGKHFYSVLISSYPGLIKQHDNMFSFFESIDNHIHKEVRKLYPDAELPTILTEILEDNTMRLIYKSKRCMGDFALGLLESASTYYNINSDINKKNITQSGSEVEFIIKI